MHPPDFMGPACTRICVPASVCMPCDKHGHPLLQEVIMEQLSFLDQLSVIRKSAIMIGPHGAAMAFQLMFMVRCLGAEPRPSVTFRMARHPVLWIWQEASRLRNNTWGGDLLSDASSSS